MTLPAAQNINLVACVSLSSGEVVPGEPNSQERQLFNFPGTTGAWLAATGANQGIVIPVVLAAAATGVSVDLANYVSSAIVISILDRGGTGCIVGKGSVANTRDTLAPYGFKLYTAGESTPATLIFDNSSTSSEAIIEITVIGNSV